jgi:MoaA/NifB/PqqE/SkfB family radical SAM enzyme
MVQPYGHLKTGSAAYAHNDGPVSPRLLALRGRWKNNFLSNPDYLGRFDEFLHGGVAGCLAGRAFFNIDSTGDIAICVERKERPIANLYRDSGNLIHRRLTAAAKGNSCKACWYNCRGEVESLYHLSSLIKSLPTLFFDHGVAERR